MKKLTKKTSGLDKTDSKQKFDWVRLRKKISGALAFSALWLLLFQTGGKLVQADVVIDNVPVGAYPTAVAVNPVTNKIYVAGNSPDLTVIDGNDNSTQSVRVGFGVDGIAIHPKANKIFVATRFNAKGEQIATLTAIDGADNSTKTILGFRWWRCPSSLGIVAYNPETNKIYVHYWPCSLSPDWLMEVDGTYGKPEIVSWGSFTKGAVNIATDKLFVADFYGTVTVIDGKDHSTNIVQVGNQPQALAINPVTNKVYVANSGSGDVTVIDGNIYASQTVGVGKVPLAIAVNTVTNKIYVANSRSNTITVINGTDNSAVTVPAGQNPQSVAVNEITNKIYVGNCDSGDVTVIDGKDNSTRTVAARKTPVAIAIGPLKHKVYVVNRDSDDVTVIDGSYR